MILTADIDEGKIKLDGKDLPGIFQSLAINGELIIDSSGAGGSGVRKILRGIGDNKVAISLVLLGGAGAYVQLEELETLFRTVNDHVPKYFTIAHPHLTARKITNVIFKGLASSEGCASDKIEVTLQFEEFVAVEYHEDSSD